MANSCQRWVNYMQLTKKSEIKKKNSSLPPTPRNSRTKKFRKKSLKKGPTSSGSTPTGPAHPARPHPALPNPSPTHHTTWNTNPSPTHTLKSNIRFQKNRKNEGAPNAKGEGAFSQWSYQRLGITCKNVLEVWKLSTVRWARYYLWDLANLFITCVVL